MAETVTIDLQVDDGSRRCEFRGGAPVLLDGGSRSIRINLCRKETQLGSTTIDQWWMDWRSVYGDRECRESNHRSIIDFYWALCLRELTDTQEQVQDSYILAHVLPHARHIGSRRVLRDSITTPRRTGRSGEQASAVDRSRIANALDALLCQSRDQEMDIVAFQDSTANAIGPPVYDDEVWSRYDSLAGELLGEGRDALEREGDRGLEVAIGLWNRWMSTFGRRRGHQLEKQVLDILSYECRAAVHRCYSALWHDLPLNLANHFGLSDEGVLFHRFWHLDRMMPSNHLEANFHLFHGHIFGLHPAGADLIQTQTGRQLIGDWLSDPEPSSSPYRRLLHGLSVAVFDYANRNQIYAELRRQRPESRGGQDLVAVEEQITEQRTGRRRVRRRNSDAR